MQEEFINCCSYDQPEENKFIGIKLTSSNNSYYISPSLVVSTYIGYNEMTIFLKIKNGISDLIAKLIKEHSWKIEAVYGSITNMKLITYSSEYTFKETNTIPPDTMAVVLSGLYPPSITFTDNLVKEEYLIKIS